MNPLDQHSTEALFGSEAMKSLRALKRAYAKLIKQHRPEQAPEAFTHIHALYEQAQAELAFRAPPDAPAAPSSKASLSAAVMELQRGDFQRGLTQLKAMAARGSDPAADVTFAALEAAYPEQTLAWLAELAGHPGRATTAVLLAQRLLGAEQDLCDAPELDALADHLTEPRDIANLALHRAQCLKQFQQGDRGIAILERASQRLPPHASGMGLNLFRARVSWFHLWMSADALDRVDRQLDDARLPLEPEEYQALKGMVRAGRSLLAGGADPRVPAVFVQLLRSSTNADPFSIASALREALHEIDDLRALIAHLDAHHPALRCWLYDIVDAVTHERKALFTWLERGAASSIEGLALGDVAKRLEVGTPRAPDPPMPPPRFDFSGKELLIFVSLVVAAYLHNQTLWACLSVGALVAAGFLYQRTVSEPKRRWREAIAAEAETRTQFNLSRFRALLAELAGPFGAFTHELAAASRRHTTDALKPCFEQTMDEALRDLHHWSDEVLRRALHDQTRAQAQAREEGAPS